MTADATDFFTGWKVDLTPCARVRSSADAEGCVREELSGLWAPSFSFGVKVWVSRDGPGFPVTQPFPIF